MTKHFLIFFLSIFQDNFVRIGTLIGLIMGFLSPYIFLNGSPIINSFIFGYIGWEIGIYMANYFNVNENTSKIKKFF